MMNTDLNASEIELLDYIKDRNASFAAWANANGLTFQCQSVEDIQLYRDLGIGNIAEYREWCDRMEEEEAAKEERKSWYDSQ